MNAPTTIPINLPGRAYEVVVGAGLLPSLGERVRAVLPRAGRCLLVVDNNLPPETIDGAGASLTAAGLAVARAPLHATEAEKTAPAVARLHEACARAGIERTDLLVALGGGIVGDVAGFAAATWMRGVAVVQCPTTLLAMVDASVGGKTGVNLPYVGGLLKNQVGAFWQPSLVLADVGTLASLPDRELRAGLAECLKHGLIQGGADDGLLAFTRDAAARVLQRDSATLVELVARNVRIKAGVVEGDERETATDAPGRAALNLGHTFGHAIEPLPGLTPTGDPADAPLLHGEAVGLGLIAAATASHALGLLDRGAVEAVRADVAGCGLPTRVAGLPDNGALLAAMRHDKKAAAGALRVVLLRSPGQAVMHTDPPARALEAGIDAIRAPRAMR